MKTKFTLLLATATISAVSLLLAGCSASSPESTAAADCTPVADVTTVASGKLTVAIADYPPYIYTDGSALKGPDGELLTKIASDLCLDLDVQKTSFTAIIEGIKSGRADMTAGDWTLNDERKATFETSAPVYKDLLGVISKTGSGDIQDFKGDKVGVVAGFLFVKDVQDFFGADNVTIYQSDTEAYQDLKAGRITAHISAQGSVASMLKKAGDTEFKAVAMKEDPELPSSSNPGYSVVLITKDNAALRDAVDTVISDFRDSGDLAKALENEGVDSSAADIPAAH